MKKNNEKLPCPFCGSMEPLFKNHPEECFLHKFEAQFHDRSLHRQKNEMRDAWNKRKNLK